MPTEKINTDEGNHFLALCYERKLGDDLGDAVRLILKRYGPVDLSEKLLLLVSGAIQFARMTEEEGRVFIQKGGWQK